MFIDVYSGVKLISRDLRVFLFSCIQNSNPMPKNTK